MANIIGAAENYKAKVAPMVAGKSAAWFERQITNTAAKGAAAQLAVAAAFMSIVDDKAGWGAMDLAHEIVSGQLTRVSQYGERAYPLTEKQIAVIAAAIAEGV